MSKSNYKTPFDVRIVDFHLRSGTVSSNDFEQHLTDLPDEAEEAEETETVFQPTYETRNYAKSPAEEEVAAVDVTDVSFH
jgi:hypothetical protein